MFIKSAKVLTGTLLAAAAISVAAPAHAQRLPAFMPGHETYIEPLGMESMEGLALGRVRGKVGSILQVGLLEYGGFPGYIEIDDDTRKYHWDGVGAAEPGDDVILRPMYDDDGNYVGTEFVSLAGPAWLSRLDLKPVEKVEMSEIDFEASEPVGLPPVSRPAPAPAPAPMPIRGMW